MKEKQRRLMILSVILLFLVLLIFTYPEGKSVKAQQPTGVIPTVTGTPTGPMASVIIYKAEDGMINIRSGPGSNYDVIGKMWINQALPVIGKSPGGDWLLIKDTVLPSGQGWIFSPYVDVSSGEIPLAEVPPTPLPITTMAIDPTLAAQFISTPIATKMPTFTPSSPLVISTYEAFDSQSFAGIPIGLLILGLFGLGLITALFSFFKTR